MSINLEYMTGYRRRYRHGHSPTVYATGFSWYVDHRYFAKVESTDTGMLDEILGDFSDGRPWLF